MGTEQRTGPTAAQHLPAGPTRMKAIVRGREVAGRVEAVGKNVTTLNRER
jgi:D-arabinose 1-dehydrogenase-like Zn-dependent alcohol dehydrogenase